MDIGNNFNIGNEVSAKAAPKKDNKKLLLILLGALVVLFMITQIISKVSGQNSDLSTIGDDTQKDQMINSTMQEAQQQLGDDFYKQASGDATIPADQAVSGTPEQINAQMNTPGMPSGTSPAQKAKEANEKLVTVDITNVGRANPFVPSVSVANYSALGGLGVPRTAGPSFPAPPTELITDESATKLMETTISGIMFDAFSPSAIVSVEGQDHLVRKGDRINGYKILNITRDRVVVQNGTNIYRATVGETLSTQNSESVNFNNVYNLQHKFGGAYAPRNTRMIQIN